MIEIICEKVCFGLFEVWFGMVESGLVFFSFVWSRSVLILIRFRQSDLRA